jgi:translocator protein
MIIVLLAAIDVTIVMAARVDRVAGWFLVPYVVWVAYATAINADVVIMN